MVDDIPPIRSNPNLDGKVQGPRGERKDLPSNRNFRRSMDRRNQQQDHEETSSIQEEKVKPSSVFDLPKSNKPQAKAFSDNQSLSTQLDKKGTADTKPKPQSIFASSSSTSSSSTSPPQSGGLKPKSIISATSFSGSEPASTSSTSTSSSSTPTSESGGSKLKPKSIISSTNFSGSQSSSPSSSSTHSVQPNALSEQSVFNSNSTASFKPSQKTPLDDQTGSSPLPSLDQFKEKAHSIIENKAKEAYYARSREGVSRSTTEESAMLTEDTNKPLDETSSSVTAHLHKPEKLPKGQILKGAEGPSTIIGKEETLSPPGKDVLGSPLTIESEDLAFNPGEEISDLKLGDPISKGKIAADAERAPEIIGSSEVKQSEKEEKTKLTSLGEVENNIPREGMINGPFSNFQTEVSSETQQPMSSAAVRDLAAQVVDQIQIMTKGHETKTTVTLSHPPILKGATITLTASENAQKEFNISFAGLSNEGKLFLDAQLQQNSLTAALENKGITVHILTTSTQAEQLFQPSEKQPQGDRRDEGQQQHQQGQREQESDQRQEEQKERQQQKRPRDREEKKDK